MVVKRGDMFYADLSPVVGSEQGGIRPVLIIQNDLGNKYSPTVIAAAITSQTNKTKLPTHIELGENKCGLKSNSVILTENNRIYISGNNSYSQFGVIGTEGSTSFTDITEKMKGILKNDENHFYRTFFFL